MRRILLVLTLALAACETPEAPPEEAEPALTLEPIGFADLAGWAADDHAAALATFLPGCARWAKKDPTAAIGRAPAYGTAADWAAVCEAAEAVALGDRTAARAFFETWFEPWRVTDGDGATGLFTGYYEPTLDGGLTPSAVNDVPLFGRPDDLVTVDLGAFAEDLAGRTVAGRVEEAALVPYEDRAAITASALDGRAAVLVWVDDPIDAFFLQIQGSGRVRLAEGGELRLGYAAQNGRSYYAIGRALVERGELTKDAVSLQTIRAWLEAHPDEADAVMNLNGSYVFFRVLDGPGPVGAFGVALTPGRSLAVDRRFVALGVPLWLDVTVPGPAEGVPDESLRRLVVAQDTGGAIKGVVRGDLFWGGGAEAEWRAGTMKHDGTYAVLLPKALVVATGD
ncbi:MAG: murein transglycosylase [Alphaproteobacteria bacterium]|nr:murein transglycosylase [Alphaproteobacteria bacterium]